MPGKNYNRPAAITDYVRRQDELKRKREMEDMSYVDNIPPSDKEKMKRMIEGGYEADMPKGMKRKAEGDYEADMSEDMKRVKDAESYRDEAYAMGGMVKKKKYAMGGSVRGGGVAIKGVGKGKVC
jgi:hypothetical protein